MSEASKPTPGPWTVSGLGGPLEQSLKIRAPSWGMVAHVGVNPSMPHWDLPQRANAALIAEAGTVHHETGLTPRQMADRMKAVESAMRDAREMIEADHVDAAYQMLGEAITDLVKGAKP